MGGASRFVTLLTSPPFRPTLLLHLPLRLLSTSPTLRHFNTSNLPLISPVKSFSSPIHTQQSNNNTTSISHPHPWPEWSRLVNSLKPSSNEVEEEQGFYVSAEQEIVNEDAFVVYEEKALSPEFVSYASDLLAFARRNPQLLGMLSRRDIEVVVTNGTPFLFRAALETARRMRTFLAVDGGNAMGADNASTVDLMKYILSYASNPAIPSSRTNIYSRELVESSIRNLMQELAVLNRGAPSWNHPAEEQIQFQDRYGQTSGPHNQNIVMKRGDWICSKCSFMNFARNNQCLECEEHKPKKTLTGGEWECPQCDFFNYGRNMVCLRCDCKRPGPIPTNLVNSTSASGPNHRPYRDVNASDIGSTTNEDFPEIMPLRRGENRFVVSTRKTPLERRQANTSEGIASGPVGAGKSNIDELVKRSLDNILGRESVNSQNEDKGITSGDNKNKEEEDKSGRWFKRMSELHGAKDLSSAVSDEDFPEIMPVRKGENRFVVSKNKNRSLTSPTEQASSSKYVPYVPFPPGYFARTEPQPPEESASPAQNIANSTNVPGDSLHTPSDNTVQSGWKGKSLEGSAVKETDPLDMSEEAKAERWFKRVAQIKDISELSQIPDEDFPSIMPMRKGVNRFVVSKRKTPMERRLTSSQYRRNLPVETNDPWRKDDNPSETK